MGFSTRTTSSWEFGGEGMAASLAREDVSVGTMVEIGAQPRLDIEAIIFLARRSSVGNMEVGEGTVF